LCKISIATYNRNPMFIKIVTGVRSHFEARFVEWVMATTLTFWGFNLAGDSQAWANPTAWEGMLRIASEETWGATCLAVGGLWLLALTINGTFGNTWYSRYSPVVRGCMAGAAAMIWFLVYTSVVTAQTSGSGIYPLPLALSIWCVFHAWRDVGRAGTNGQHTR
jgi:hypothetical protein